MRTAYQGSDVRWNHRYSGIPLDPAGGTYLQSHSVAGTWKNEGTWREGTDSAVSAGF